MTEKNASNQSGGSWSRYRKTITAVVGAGVAFATLVVTSEPAAISSSEWLSGGIGLVTALGVYRVGNEP
jgi:hypothetical protein